MLWKRYCNQKQNVAANIKAVAAHARKKLSPLTRSSLGRLGPPCTHLHYGDLIQNLDVTDMGD